MALPLLCSNLFPFAAEVPILPPRVFTASIGAMPPQGVTIFLIP
jgi:hypothetical protein